MTENAKILDVEKIVEQAFDYFGRFVERGEKLEDVLLEELEQLDDEWIVTIGFNGTRRESSEPATGGFAGLAGFGSKTTTTVREVRHILLDNEGNFKKIT